MAGIVDIKLEGGERLLKALQSYEPKIRNRIVRESMNKALAPVLRLAEQMAPMDTGLLNRNLKIRPGKRRRNAVSRTVATTERAHYGTFQEYGFKLGRRASNETIGLRKGKKRNASQRAAVEAINNARPSIEAQPFMRPAMRAYEDRIPELFASEIRAALAAGA